MVVCDIEPTTKLKIPADTPRSGDGDFATHIGAIVDFRRGAVAPDPNAAIALRVEFCHGSPPSPVYLPSAWWVGATSWLAGPAMVRGGYSNAGPTPTWGRWIALWILPDWVPFLRWLESMARNKSNGAIANSLPFGPTHFPPIWAGGGFRLDSTLRNELIAKHMNEGGAVALNPWGEWYGDNAININE